MIQLVQWIIFLLKWMKLFKQLLIYRTAKFILLFIKWINRANCGLYTANLATVIFKITADVSNIIILERLVLQ